MSHFHRCRAGSWLFEIFWRRALDWAGHPVPSSPSASNFLLGRCFFSFLPAGAQNSPPPASPLFCRFFALMNYLRTVSHVSTNFAWTADRPAIFRLLRAPFTYELEGEDFLNELGRSGEPRSFYRLHGVTTNWALACLSKNSNARIDVERPNRMI